MSAPPELPKGLLRYMLERFLPRDLKGESIRGDLLEEFRALAERSSDHRLVSKHGILNQAALAVA